MTNQFTIVHIVYLKLKIMKYICTELVNESIEFRGVNMIERQNIQKRIRFLQRSLVQLSFTSNKNRSQIYSSLIQSLEKAQFLLLKNKKLERNILNAK